MASAYQSFDASARESSSVHTTETEGVPYEQEYGNRRLLAAVLQHLSDGFLFTDPSGQVMLTNAALERMLGRPAATLLGRPLPADLAPGVGPVIGQALEIASEPAVGEISLEDGRRILVSAWAVMGEPGTVNGVVTTLRDVSRRRAAEQVKENVLAAISHEFRTPLASIVGFAALAAKTLSERLAPAVPAEDSKARRALTRLADHLRRIHESGQHLEQMVNNLLDLADMAAGRLQWEMADVSPYDVIQSALSTVVSQAEDKELPIRLALPPDLPVVRGDRARLTQVVTQLLSNAVKFTDQGEVWILANVLRVGAGQRPAAPISLPTGNYLQISVTDTGCGIPPESLSHIFEEFFQAGASLADGQAGMGLGLVISRQIVEHHGGHIWAESEPGVGSTFSFALPLRTRAHLAQPILVRELRHRLATMAPEAPSLQAVLLAHANADLRRLLDKEFRSDGLAVLTAFDGEACRHAVESKRPSVLVLDLFLPKLDALGELSLPPTLLLSAVEIDDGGLRVALGEAMTGLAGVDLSLHSVPSLLALAWEACQPEGRLLILDVDAPSLSGITETLYAQGFESVLSQADTSEPDQALLEAALALLRPARVKSMSRYRNQQRDLCTVVLVEF